VKKFMKRISLGRRWFHGEKDWTKNAWSVVRPMCSELCRKEGNERAGKGREERKGCSIASINHYFSVRLKFDQRAGQRSLPHVRNN